MQVALVWPPRQRKGAKQIRCIKLGLRAGAGYREWQRETQTNIRLLLVIFPLLFHSHYSEKGLAVWSLLFSSLTRNVQKRSLDVHLSTSNIQVYKCICKHLPKKQPVMEKATTPLLINTTVSLPFSIQTLLKVLFSPPMLLPHCFLLGNTQVCTVLSFNEHCSNLKHANTEGIAGWKMDQCRRRTALTNTDYWQHSLGWFVCFKHKN